MRTSFDTPVGTLHLEATAQGITQAGNWMRDDPEAEADTSDGAKQFLDQGLLAFTQYFEGQRKTFDDLTLDLKGTDFQCSVWQQLLDIPYGVTTTYADIAERLHNPKAVRAVGLANGRNPVGVIVPCHRVIGSDGSLTGYGGGLPMKEWLLRHEGALI